MFDRIMTIALIILVVGVVYVGVDLIHQINTTNFAAAFIR